MRSKSRRFAVSCVREVSCLFFSLHWYLAIIYGPEYFILPPSAASSTGDQTLPQPIPEPPEPTEKPPSTSVSRVPRLTSPSETQGDAEVEDILHFRSSCSISPPEDDAKTVSGSSNADRNEEGAEGDPIVVEEAHDWLLASSPPFGFSDDMMDVDQPLLLEEESGNSSTTGVEPSLRSRSLEVQGALSSDLKPPDREIPKAFGLLEDPLNLGDDDVAMNEPPFEAVDPVSFYGPGPARHSIGKKYSRRSVPKDDSVRSDEEPVEIVSIQNAPERSVVLSRCN
jgi:hypothetical protein